ncbi:hypothetical protein J437_LFUL001692 [Ladona fulva]|uniref:DDE Tnp4 domain-containing protein n=1 Tax=Ladona fulva TaxID=123851 RepID=A0A8K0NZG6_LADFU|nr:hypothetical protein J437_LFUL001692 [Ladona fulva]
MCNGGMVRRVIQLPVPDTSMLVASADGYLRRWIFPNCVASIDGKHIRVKCPSNSGSIFYNYKGLADANYTFLVIEVGAYSNNQMVGYFQIVFFTIT